MKEYNLITAPKSNLRYNALEPSKAHNLQAKLLYDVHPRVTVARVYMGLHGDQRFRYRYTGDQFSYARWCMDHTRVYLCGQYFEAEGADFDARQADTVRFLRTVAFSAEAIEHHRRVQVITAGQPKKAKVFTTYDAMLKDAIRRVSSDAFYSFMDAPKGETLPCLVGRCVEVMATSDEEGEVRIAEYLSAELGA